MICQADARRIPIAGESVQCVITSPPYWGLRDYGVGDQIGLEATPEEYVAHMVETFREVWRVLRTDGTAWLNLGDSYASDSKGSGGPSEKQLSNAGSRYEPRRLQHGLKPKDLVGIPWRVAFALQADGWYLRQDIIWSKPNPMPESVTDRCTKAHEYVFLLAKAERYYYDGGAIREGAVCPDDKRRPLGSQGAWEMDGRERGPNGGGKPHDHDTSTRNKRSVWTVPTQPYSGAHFAAFPPALIEPMVVAGCPKGGTVLDPFCGSGTVGQVCRRHGRRFVGLDLSFQYLRDFALPRAEQTQAHESVAQLPMFGGLP